jgi:hypothetical protein
MLSLVVVVAYNKRKSNEWIVESSERYSQGMMEGPPACPGELMGKYWKVEDRCSNNTTSQVCEKSLTAV